MNTYTITSSSVLWECGKVGDFSIFPQKIEKKNLLNCIQKCSHKIFGFCIINKKLDTYTHQYSCISYIIFRFSHRGIALFHIFFLISSKG